jgi:murein DD-endopeptidase MepM/ murein hydrolase activator NlpD
MWNKIKNACRMNKAAVITGITLVVSLGIIIGVTAAANRARRAPVETGDVATTTVPSLTVTDPIPSDTRPSSTTAASGTTAATTAARTSVAAQVQDEPPAFVLPVSGAMTKGHDLTLQVFSNTMRDWRVHNGIDIAATAGSPVYAAADGTVSAIWEDVSYGTCISVAHSGDCITYYKNLNPILADGIAVGTEIEQGQLIAAVGESAMVEIADEPHLHFELSVEGEYVDPTEYFDSASVAVLEKDTAYEG